MYSSIKKQLFLSVFITLSTISYAIDISQLQFEVLDIKDGLSQNSVYDIYQDCKGYIWFCTNEGVNRYDGYNFIKYDKQLKVSNSLVSNFTTCITESSPGIFWIGTEKGFSVLLYETNTYINFENPALIRKIIVEDSLTVLIQTPYSVYKARLVEIKSKEYTVQLEALNAYKEVLCKIDKHHIYFINRNHQLCTYDVRTKLIKPIQNQQIWQSIIQKKITEVVKDHFNNYWIGTNVGLYRLNETSNEVDSFPVERNKFIGLQDRITGITVGKLNNIYITTYQHGLIIFDNIKKRFINYENDIYNLESIPDNKTQCVLTDNSNTLWVGTKSSGVAFCSAYKYKFKHITQDPYKTTWLSNKYILCFASDNKDNIWIGTDGGGLFKYDTKENMFSNWRNNASSSSLSNDVVQSLIMDSNHQLWIGTLNGICKFNPNTNSFQRFFITSPTSISNLKLPSYSTIRLFETTSKEIYAFTDISVFKFNPYIYRFEAVKFQQNLSNIQFRSILEDTDNTLWAATNLGLFHIDKNTGLIDKEPLNKINNTYFKTDQLYSIIKNSVDKLWIGTGNSGLFLFNKNTKQIEQNYTKENGLSSNFIYGILKDKQGKLWLSTNKGINMFDPILKQFRSYDVNDGLQSNEFNSGAYHKTNDGKLLFGGINGFNIIEPAQIPFNNNKPFTNIINIKTDFNNYNSTQYAQQKNKIKFANNENSISFEFASSDYANTLKNNFEYKLDGYDNNWSRTNRNFASYNKLPPGNYTFYVRASNNDGIWSEQPASFSFRIRPMVWQTWWFKIFISLLILAYLYRFTTERIQLANRKAKEQSKLAQQKAEFDKQLAEIKLKALVAQMNPHFIFNCMNSIQAMILSDQNMEASAYLTKLARLVRAVLENSVNTFIPLNDVIEKLKLYLELESLRFDHQFNYNIHLENIDVYSIEMPSMLLQPYVENAIWHGLLKKEGEKNLQINFFKEFNYLVCEIYDNGIGRAKAAELNLKKQHKSLGTLITKEMFDTLHKIKEADYHVEIIDLYDENHFANGTKIVIRIEII